MKTAEELRRENLEALIEQFGSLRALAEAAETNPAYISQVRNALKESSTGKPKEIGTALARRLERAAGKERGWMDHERSTEEPMVAEEGAAYFSLACDLAALLPEDAAAFIEQIRAAAEKVRRIRALGQGEPPGHFAQRVGKK
jgi:hypothetical protein